ncbi:MAG: short chain dehydrogenase [Bryobacteraceae bacterium]
MKILLVGSSGTIGSAVAQALGARHEVLRARHSGPGMTVDLADPESIRRLYAQTGKVDAVVCAAGPCPFGPLLALSDADFAMGLASKLMGQINLVRSGIESVTDGGSFTLTTGILARKPMPGGAVASVANAGLEGFARAAAIELPRGLRINVAAPGWITETLIALKMDPSGGTPAAQAAQFYVKAVEGSMTGQIID